MTMTDINIMRAMFKVLRSMSCKHENKTFWMGDAVGPTGYYCDGCHEYLGMRFVEGPSNMKRKAMTLSEAEEFKRKKKKERKEFLNKVVQDMYAVALSVKKDFINPDLRKSYLAMITEYLKNGRPKIAPSPYMCDHCGTRLFNPYPGAALASNPPKYHISCAGCGFCGYTTLKDEV